MFNLFKKKSTETTSEKQNLQKEIAKEKFEWAVDAFRGKHKEIEAIEKRMQSLEDHVLHHPDEYIKNFENSINAYYDLKEYCYNFGDEGKTYFKQMWQECHNSKSSKFDYIDYLQEQLYDYKKNYQNYIEQYKLTVEALQRAGHKKEDEKEKNIFVTKMLRIDERSNIYMNNQDNYISDIGKRCVEYEKSLSDFAKCYQYSVCPNCGEIVELPKRKKACPKCKKTIHIVKGGIKQGNMALRDKEYLILKQMRDDFYIEREYNKNYHLKVDIKKAYY